MQITKWADCLLGKGICYSYGFFHFGNCAGYSGNCIRKQLLPATQSHGKACTRQHKFLMLVLVHVRSRGSFASEPNGNRTEVVMKNKQNCLIHHEILSIPQSGLSQVCSLSPAVLLGARGSYDVFLKPIPNSFLLSGRQHFRHFLDQLPETKAWFCMRIAGHPLQAPLQVCPVTHKHYHTKLTPTRPCKCWLRNFYAAILRQESASCFGIGLCHWQKGDDVD